MSEPRNLDEAFLEFSRNNTKWAPDGILEIDLASLCNMGLMSQKGLSEDPNEVTQYFQVDETGDKITLHNEKFAIWIVPEVIGETPRTLTYISQLKKKGQLGLELIYATKGVYNTPHFILRVLEHFLNEVIDTDAAISSISDE